MKQISFIFLIMITSKVGYSVLLPVCKDESVSPVFIEKYQIDPEILDTIHRYVKSAEEFKIEISSRIKMDYFTNKFEILDSFYQNAYTVKIEEIKYREKLVGKYLEFIDGYRNDKQIQDILFRTMILAFEDASEKYIGKLNEFIEDTGKKRINLKEPRADYSQVINYSIKLENMYPEFQYIDIVLYIRGFCHAEMGRVSESVKTFEKMISKNPDSTLISEAYMLIAEYNYIKSNFDNAINFFNKVLPYKTESYYKKALFRLGQIYFIKKNFLKSLASHIEFLDILHMSSKNEFSEDMLLTSVDQIAEIFYKEKEINDLINYFNSIGPRSYQFDIFEKVGFRCEEDKNFKKGIEIYKTMIKLFPLDKKIPFIHNKLVSLYEIMGQREVAVREREIMMIKFSKGGKWNLHNNKETDVLRSVEKIMENYLVEMAGYYYSYGKKTKNSKSLNEAIKLYELYLSRYSASTENLVASINYNIADIKVKLNSLKEAEIYYNRSIRRNCRSEINGKAFLGLIRIYNAQIDKFESGGEKKYLIYNNKYKLSGAQSLNENYKKLLDVLNGYEKYGLKQERGCLVGITKGEAYYKHNLYDDARKELKKVFYKCNSSFFKKGSAEMILGSYVFQKNWPQIKKWSGELTALGVKEKVLFETGENLLAGDLYFNAQNMEKRSDFLNAAKAYLELQRKYPQNELAPKSQFSAAGIYENLNMLSLAVKNYLVVVNKYPESSLSEESAFKIALLNEKRFSFDDAVKNYTRYTKKYPKGKYFSVSLKALARISEAKKNYKKAIKYYIKYMPLLERSEKYSIVKKVASLHHKNKKILEAISFIDKHISDPEVNTHFKFDLFKLRGKIISESFTRPGKLKHYKKFIEFAETIGDEKKDYISYLAEAKFELLENQFIKYLKEGIGSGAKTLWSQIDRKFRELISIKNRYMDIYELGDVEYKIASLYKIGRLYYGYGKMISSVKLPSVYDEKEKIEYRNSLKKRRYSLENEGFKLFSEAIKIAKEENVFSDWIKRILEEVAKHTPSGVNNLVIPSVPILPKHEKEFNIVLEI